MLDWIGLNECILAMRKAAQEGRAKVDAAAAKVADLENRRSELLSMWEHEVSEAQRKGTVLQGSANPHQRYNDRYALLSIELDRAKREVRESIEAIAEEMNAIVRLGFRLDASQLNDDLRLLDLGLSKEEVVEICERNKNNATMLRAIRNHFSDDPEMLLLIPLSDEERISKGVRELKSFCSYVALGQISRANLDDPELWENHVPAVLR